MRNDMSEISNCEVCGSNQLMPVLDLGSHPMCDDLVKSGDSRICNEYPIDILFCKSCNTAHQRYQVKKEYLFPMSYHYRARFTADVLKGMAGLVDSCMDKMGDMVGKKVLDIGCNDGSLLDKFKEAGAQTYGIEPTGAFRDAVEKGHVVYNAYLSEDIATKLVDINGRPDIITFTNVFAHIEDLAGVIRSLKMLMKDDTVVVVENHYLGAVFNRNQFDTFYHEHPRTYSYTSFKYIARSLDSSLLGVEFPSRYGGNIRVFMGRGKDISVGNPVDLDKMNDDETRFNGMFSILRRNMEHWREKKRIQLEGILGKHSKLNAKAFPGRAAILIKLLDLNENHIAAVYEKPGSMKIGHYVPGTRIPICSEVELFDKKEYSLPLLNLAWHISAEIKAYCKENGYAGDIIDIVNEDDFI